MCTYAHEADEFLVADSLVGFVDGGGTVWATSVAEAGVSAAVVVSTLVPELELALGRTTRTLPRTQHQVRGGNVNIFIVGSFSNLYATPEEIKAGVSRI